MLETGSFMPTKHPASCSICSTWKKTSPPVDDVMIPRRRIEALDFDAPFEQILHQLETHDKLVVYQREGDIDRVLSQRSACAQDAVRAA